MNHQSFNKSRHQFLFGWREGLLGSELEASSAIKGLK
jgi:hypothetical protein